MTDDKVQRPGTFERLMFREFFTCPDCGISIDTANNDMRHLKQVLLNMETELRDTKMALEMIIAEFYHYEVGREGAMKRVMNRVREEGTR